MAQNGLQIEKKSIFSFGSKCILEGGDGHDVMEMDVGVGGKPAFVVHVCVLKVHVLKVFIFKASVLRA